MTLEGWIISKQMYAGLIPGVNIKTRPRVHALYIYLAVNDSMFSVYSALASHPHADFKVLRDMLMDYAIPPLSPEKKKEEETAQMIDFLKKMDPKAIVANPAKGKKQ